MAGLSKTKVSADPVCPWCGTAIGLVVENVAFDPAAGLPQGVGIRVCSPGCPKRPEGVVVSKRKRWS